ncbi:hypothetical protein GCM10010208_64760 [Actinomadura livida]|nr:hypothetical protein GCM10010208_64760 [Actinomadura livida]
MADFQVGRDGFGVSAGGGDLEGVDAAAARGDRDDVVRAEPVGGPVDAAAVDQDVAVHDELARLVDGAGESGAQHEGVQPALQADEEFVAGLAPGLRGLGEGVAELRLADVVLRAEPLLLAEPELVTGLLLAGPAVHAGRVGAGFEVLDGLRGQGDAERPRQANFRTGVVHHAPQVVR